MPGQQQKSKYVEFTQITGKKSLPIKDVRICERDGVQKINISYYNMKKSLLVAYFCLASLVLCAQDSSTLKSPNAFVLGPIERLQSKILSETRTLNIYLPPGYKSSDTVRYPVIYLLDGSADEDFIHISGLVQFLNFPWVNVLPESIVVGIATVDRRRDFTYHTTIEKDKKAYPTTGRSKEFINFIASELQPFIEKKYKTTGSKTIIGQSLGGLLATEILFKRPELFSTYFIVSSSLWWDNESLLRIKPKVLSAEFKDHVSIYIAVGNEEKVMQADSRKLASILKASPKKNITTYFEYFPKEDHGTILHNAVYKGFQLMKKKK